MTSTFPSGTLRFEPPSRPGLRLGVLRGDITKIEADAIVNAANQRMLGGGGVDGAIHRAAGPQLLEACRAVPEVGPGVRCPTGEARATPGFNLRAGHVIHTVGPVYASAGESAPLLAAAYRSCLRAATERGLKSVAFPAISCGIYGYPLSEAAEIALGVCLESEHSVEQVLFVLFDEAAFEAWTEAAKRLLV